MTTVTEPRTYSACNAHADLAEQLENCIDTLELLHNEMTQHRCTIDCPDIGKRVMWSRAALAKARGERVMWSRAALAKARGERVMWSRAALAKARGEVVSDASVV